MKGDKIEEEMLVFMLAHPFLQSLEYSSACV